jgi:DNA-binding CsgD family transcriptional regulator
MARTYEWSQRIATLIARLPVRGSAAFWALVEGSGQEAALPPEVLAYLVREAYAQSEPARAERVFSLLWDRYAAHVFYYARAYSARLQRAMTAEDVMIDVFTLLCQRLRVATDVTFYECCFLPGIKRLTLDKVQRMEDEPLVSLTVQREEGDEEQQQDLPDHAAIDPMEHAEERERQEDLRALLPERLHDLAEKAQRTALLLMQGRTEGEIAGELGVTTRMVTNYKAAIRRALSDL